ncbi:protein kinase domain-containing protein [Ornithinibacillus xuwenensis]|uniref:Serine/threonine protein kinase n=1 Tax=Ornithinibacillus xuwenensis TaxID=3144668 RepID=A0ABU9XGK3_9BACI
MNKRYSLNQISFQLKEDHNFEWISHYGKVFCVYDQQDSGNISFGIEKNGVKRFLKYAGAKTINGSVEPDIAIANLRRSISLYEDLRHPYLVNLIDHFELESGYALLFEWFEGESLHNHWVYPPPHKYNHPDSPFFRFKQLPVEKRIQSLNHIFEFHVQMERKSYVAVDFYDGSILYDFIRNDTRVCDIDLYQRKPFQNPMGRLWGSSRFMSPEEFELGAVIDEKTNVFNMGAIAFGLLGGELDRSLTKWDAGEVLYDIVKKAVEVGRDNRYASVEEFYSRWKAALNSTYGEAL